MTQVQCHSWKRKAESKPKQKSMTGNNYMTSSRTKYLVESFILNSENRVVSRKGKERKPDPSFRKESHGQFKQLSAIVRQSGKKVKDIDLQTLTLHFNSYVKVVNLLLERIYSTNERARKLGEKLSKYRGRGYTLLGRERDLCYQHNDDIKKLVFERLHRNALEQAARMVLADYSRRQLFVTALEQLDGSEESILKLMARKRLPPELIRIVRDSCESTKKNGSGYHYALGVLKQVRFALNRVLLDSLNLKIGWRGGQRAKIRALLKKGSKDQSCTLSLIRKQIHDWVSNGYPFTNPQLRNYSLDFSASTENSRGQGYWFSLDKERGNEILLHLKLSPGIEGKHHNDSPYKSKTLTFRFLDWFPRASFKDREKAIIAKGNGEIHRAEQFLFRVIKFEDMHQQLLNTIDFQRTSHKLSRLKQSKNPNTEDITKLERKKRQLKDSRRSAPPRLILKGNRVILQIPFLSPNGEVSSQILGKKKYQTFAGVDRGLRAPVALSVEKQDSFEDLLITVDYLVMKRERLKKHAYRHTSIVTRKKNNWDKKRSGQYYPAIVLKQDRYISALWRKICRLDREIARQVSSQTVWFCEEHLVKKVFFEDLRSFQAHAGSKDLSWSLSTNLWGKIIETVRYMRSSLGHSPYSVWTVNPRYTSQTCHRCGERGIRVDDETSTTEKKGGEYFYCAKCDMHFHADINAARNIIHVQDNKSSAVPGRTKDRCPSLSNLQ